MLPVTYWFFPRCFMVFPLKNCSIPCKTPWTWAPNITFLDISCWNIMHILTGWKCHAQNEKPQGRAFLLSIRTFSLRDIGKKLFEAPCRTNMATCEVIPDPCRSGSSSMQKYMGPMQKYMWHIKFRPSCILFKHWPMIYMLLPLRTFASVDSFPGIFD